MYSIYIAYLCSTGSHLANYFPPTYRRDGATSGPGPRAWRYVLGNLFVEFCCWLDTPQISSYILLLIITYSLRFKMYILGWREYVVTKFADWKIISDVISIIYTHTPRHLQIKQWLFLAFSSPEMRFLPSIAHHCVVPLVILKSNY